MKIKNSIKKSFYQKLFYVVLLTALFALTACGTGFEDDDNGASPDPWQGTLLFGTPEIDEAYDIALDTSGNIYITGQSQGDLDGNTNAGKGDIFLARFKPSGEKEWVHLMGSDEYERGNALAVDSNGNSYITGRSHGNIWDYTMIGAVESDYDYFLAKFDTSGEKIWSHHLGTTRGNQGNDIQIDADNIIHVAGYTYDGLNGDSGEGGWDAFLLKYDAAGDLTRTTLFGGTGTDFGYSTALDSTGNIYISGFTQNDLDGTNAGGDDIFLAQYNYTKSPVNVWTRQTGAFGDDIGYDITVDNDDNIYITGITSSTLDGYNHVFLVKYSSLGDKLWTRVVGSDNNDAGRCVAVDSDNNVYVTGHTSGGLDGNINAGGNDVFLMKYSSSGAKQWTKQVGTPYKDLAYNMAINKKENSDDDIFITGYSDGNLDGNTNSNEGVSSDIFIMKFNTSGEIQ
ncbi:MAG: hypothetical protein GY754_23185 [bacterium]|nr:hypothetical protein [bacterium]